MTMKKPIRTIPEFVATLDSRQRKFFLDHLDSRERALQSAVSQLAQGMGSVGQLLSEDTLLRVSLAAGQ